MCRFALYLGPPIRLAALFDRPEHGLVRQAQHSYEGKEEVNPDGWGVAWYVPHLVGVPALYKDVTPAWQCDALLALAHDMRSRCILAHVRAASPGLGVSQLNCHPFTWGGLTFMHNGAVEDFERLKPAFWAHLSPRARKQIKGSTDSEHLFALFTDRYLDSTVRAPLERLTDAMRRTLADLDMVRHWCRSREPSFLNLAASDGRRAVVTRTTLGDADTPRSLYLRTGLRTAHDPDDPERIAPFVVVASEPLEIEHPWRPIQPGHLVSVEAGRRVRIETVRHIQAKRTVA
ncbi:MAG: class II glutamine amidotransferase [Planctomycetota bacterium]|nr:class II glutamine amidotransferase [Planctomycetota bacterium]